MKKILLSITACVMAMGSLQAQQKHSILSNPVKAENLTFKNMPSKERFKNTTKKSRGGSIYLNYMDFVAAKEGMSATQVNDRGGLYYCFPDSTVRFNPPNNAYGMSYKSIGQVLDPSAQAIYDNTPTGNIFISTSDAYVVDSLFVLGSYAKVSGSVDTLIVSLVHSGGANLPNSGFSGQSAAFGVDTTRFKVQSYAASTFNSGGPFQSNIVGAPAAMVIKHVLTNSDSSDYTMGESSFGLKYIGISTGPGGFAVPAGEQVSVSYTFKPGYTYAAGDTIGKFNKYLFLSYEANGDNTFMPYYPGDWNQSSVIYKDSSNGWSGDYIPTLAWSVGYGPEIHDIVWRITSASANFIGVNDLKDSGIQVSVSPNPASENAAFQLTLKESAKKVTISIANNIGQVIKTIDLGSVQADQSKAQSVKVSDLAKGMYIYTVNADGKKYSDKLLVK